jgi:hypothetical protein
MLGLLVIGQNRSRQIGIKNRKIEGRQNVRVK